MQHSMPVSFQGSSPQKCSSRELILHIAGLVKKQTNQIVLKLRNTL